MSLLNTIDMLPIAIRESDRGVVWKRETRDGRPTKIPYCPRRTTMKAAVNDPTTWASFREAVAVFEAGQCDGPGVVLGGPTRLIGVDLDKCRDPETGAITPEARAIIDELRSYTEISPSGDGVHIIVTGTLPPGRRRHGHVEMYAEGRFFTITGAHLPGSPLSIAERTAAIATVHAREFPVDAPPEQPRPAAPAADDDAALLRRARKAQNGAKFSALWAGDTAGYPSASEADLALASLLAFWTGRDASRMDRLFRQSGLMRPKWDTRHGRDTYGNLTIEHAIAGIRGDTFGSHGAAAARGASAGAGDAPPGDQADRRGPIPLGDADPKTGRLVLSPRRTRPTAIAYVRTFYQHPLGQRLFSYAGLLLEWRENRYTELEDAAVICHLQDWLHQALRYIVLDHRARTMGLVDFESNPQTIHQALDSIRAYTHLPASTEAPSWLDQGPHLPPLELLPCLSGTVHLPTRTVVPATPAFFTTTALDFDFDPQAPPPSQWLTFLGELWGDDADSIALLQEWFGYCLVADTSQQKMLLLVGPRRSGKGTIGRVLTRLVGTNSVVGPTTASLAGDFGLQPLMGKSLAIVSDARFAGEGITRIVERLLCISGEDRLSVDRKFLGAVTLKLPTRFLFLANELPRFSDASIALAGRFLVLRLNRSFYGEEDPFLTARLCTELPSILLWAIEGWSRLRQRGMFVQSAAAQDAIEDLEDLASPTRPFLRDFCTLHEGLRVPIDTLWGAWELWCHENGRRPGTKQSFGRDLVSAAPQVRWRRTTGLEPFYQGLTITAETAEALDRWLKARSRATGGGS